MSIDSILDKNLISKSARNMREIQTFLDKEIPYIKKQASEYLKA
jgi:hypothetical protein